MGQDFSQRKALHAFLLMIKAQARSPGVWANEIQMKGVSKHIGILNECNLLQQSLAPMGDILSIESGPEVRNRLRVGSVPGNLEIEV